MGGKKEKRKKPFNDFSLEVKVGFINNEGLLIHDLKIVYEVEAFITLNCKA